MAPGFSGSWDRPREITANVTATNILQTDGLDRGIVHDDCTRAKLGLGPGCSTFVRRPGADHGSPCPPGWRLGPGDGGGLGHGGHGRYWGMDDALGVGPGSHPDRAGRRGHLAGPALRGTPVFLERATSAGCSSRSGRPRVVDLARRLDGRGRRQVRDQRCQSLQYVRRPCGLSVGAGADAANRVARSGPVQRAADAGLERPDVPPGPGLFGQPVPLRLLARPRTLLHHDRRRSRGSSSAATWAVRSGTHPSRPPWC